MDRPIRAGNSVETYCRVKRQQKDPKTGKVVGETMYRSEGGRLIEISHWGERPEEGVKDGDESR